MKDICESFGRERERGRFENVLEGLVLGLCLSWVWKRERERDEGLRMYDFFGSMLLCSAILGF